MVSTDGLRLVREWSFGIGCLLPHPISKLVFQNCSSKKRGFFQKLDYVGLSFWVAVTIHTETTPVGTILDCRTSRSDSESKTDIVMTQHWDRIDVIFPFDKRPFRPPFTILPLELYHNVNLHSLGPAFASHVQTMRKPSSPSSQTTWSQSKPKQNSGPGHILNAFARSE